MFMAGDGAILDNHFSEQLGNVLLRGGRLTKTRGLIASYAPCSGAQCATGSVLPSPFRRLASMLGSSVSMRTLSARAFAVTLAAAAPLALTVTGAHAGVCTETFAGSGVFVCSGAANAGTDVTQTPTPPAGGALDVSTLPGFGIDVTTPGNDAIFLINAVNDTNITFTDNNASAITGNGDGIVARNSGTGFTSITTTGVVTGTTDNGIIVTNFTAATDLTINAQGAVSGGDLGIFVRNRGSGALSVTTEAVTGLSDDGILATNYGTGDLTIITQGLVSGGGSDGYGINVNNFAGSNVSITTQAVSSLNDDAINVENTGSTGTLTINIQGAVSGGDEGIRAVQSSTGALSITTRAITAGGSGVSVNNSKGSSLTINTQGAVIGGTFGIIVNSNAGGGAASITTQAVTGMTSSGIYARNALGESTSLTINAQGAVSGKTDGISVRNSGSGALSITTQAVTGTGTNSDGIDARNNSAVTTSLTIKAQGAVTGGGYGIYATNNGTGAMSITTQAVTGTNREGIYARNDGTDLTINTQGAVLGKSEGIFAKNEGSGALSITTQAVTTTNSEAIYANNDGTDLTIVAHGALSGGDEGIRARNSGSGALSITTMSTVTGIDEEGIDARNSKAGTSLTIVAKGAVSTTSLAGILADNDGTGPTTITTSGGVTGTTGILVRVRTNTVATTINNSAAITGTGGVAINFQGNGNDTLNLFGGSVINGTIDFGNGNDGLGGTNPNDIDTLNVGPGVNAVLTFADAGGTGQGDNALQSAPENTSSNVALINGGTQAVAVDPTGFAAMGAALGSLISSIFNSIDNNGSGAQASASPAGGTGIVPAGGDVAYGAGRRLWVSGFGGKQKVKGSSNQAGIDNRFGGAITGVESSSGGSTYGVFGGYAVSKLDLEFNAGDIEFDSAFGGAYWKINTGAFNVNLAIVAGSADQDTSRNVGGINARGESDGWFISPSITVAAPMEFYAQPVIFSARVSYAGLFLDGYTETGVVNPLTVSDRDVHILNTRAQFSLPYNVAGKDGSKTRLDLRAGVDAQFDAGSDNAALLVGGTALNFSADLDNEVAGFLGTTIAYTSASGIFSFSASGEVQSTFDGGYKAVGQVRGAVRF